MKLDILKRILFRYRHMVFGVTILSMASLVNIAHADEGDIVAYPLILDLNSGPHAARFSDISISNLDTQHTEFVQISVQKREELHGDQEDWVTIHPNPADSDIGVSWSKGALPPGGVRVLRVIDFSKQPPKSDAVYEVTVTPTVPAFVQRGQIPVHRVYGHLGLVFAYKILVILRPEHPAVMIDVHREKGQLVLHNAGNTEALLEHIQVCHSGDRDCHSVPPERLYPDETIQFQVPESGHLTLIQDVQGHELSLQF